MINSKGLMKKMKKQMNKKRKKKMNNWNIPSKCKTIHSIMKLTEIAKGTSL